MTAKERERIRRIASAIRLRKDYSVLADGGQQLVFAAAREIGVGPAQLIRLWETGATGLEAKRTRVVVEVDDDADRDDADDRDQCDEDDPDCDDADDSDSEDDDDKENQDDEDDDTDTDDEPLPKGR